MYRYTVHNFVDLLKNIRSVIMVVKYNSVMLCSIEAKHTI